MGMQLGSLCFKLGRKEIFVHGVHFYWLSVFFSSICNPFLTSTGEKFSIDGFIHVISMYQLVIFRLCMVNNYFQFIWGQSQCLVLSFSITVFNRWIYLQKNPVTVRPVKCLAVQLTSSRPMRQSVTVIVIFTIYGKEFKFKWFICTLN